jgi:hypothetical protein
MHAGRCHEERFQRVLSYLRSGVLALLVLAAAAGVPPRPAAAGVFHSKESALRLAFGEVDSVITRSIVLDDHETARIEQLARTNLPSRLVNAYVGYRGGAVVATAFIETHRVRSLPETLLVVVGPDGRNRGVHLLAFHEPPEYQPTVAWLGQFTDRPLTDELALRRGVAGIAGSTLTAVAVTACVRRVMAIHEVCLAPSVAGTEYGTGTAAAVTGPGDAGTH